MYHLHIELMFAALILHYNSKSAVVPMVLLLKGKTVVTSLIDLSPKKKCNMLKVHLQQTNVNEAKNKS